MRLYSYKYRNTTILTTMAELPLCEGYVPSQTYYNISCKDDVDSIITILSSYGITVDINWDEVLSGLEA